MSSPAISAALTAVVDDELTTAKRVIRSLAFGELREAQEKLETLLGVVEAAIDDWQGRPAQRQLTPPRSRLLAAFDTWCEEHEVEEGTEAQAFVLFLTKTAKAGAST